MNQADGVLQGVARILHHIVQHPSLQPGCSLLLADIGSEDHHRQASLQQYLDRFPAGGIR